MNLTKRRFGGVKVYFRAGVDDHVLKEVIEQRVYRRVRAHFDVQFGETWLDLGANVGAFAAYCAVRGAVADCYEPDPDCYLVLKKNVDEWNLMLPATSRRAPFRTFNAAVTAQNRSLLMFFRSNRGDQTRGTLLKVNGYTQISQAVNNVYAGNLKVKSYDGVKMDIEGSEGGILDEWLLPNCRKLVLEYHTSRDQSVANLRRRIANIRKHFAHVQYPPEYDRILTSGETNVKTYFDRFIFAWND